MGKALELLGALRDCKACLLGGFYQSFRFPGTFLQTFFQSQSSEVAHYQKVDQRTEHREQADDDDPAHLKFCRLILIDDMNDQERPQHIHDLPDKAHGSSKPGKACQ